MNFKRRPPLFDCAPAPSGDLELDSPAKDCFQSTAYGDSDAPTPTAGPLQSMPEKFPNHDMQASVFGILGWVIAHSAQCRAAHIPAAVLPIALQHHLNQRDDAMKFDLPLSNTCRVGAAGLAPCSSPTDGDNASHRDHASTPLSVRAPASSSHLALDSRAEECFQSTAYPDSDGLEPWADSRQSTPEKLPNHSAQASVSGIRGWAVMHSAQCRAAHVLAAVLPIALQHHLHQRDDAMKFDVPLSSTDRAGAAGLPPRYSPADRNSSRHCDLAAIASVEVSHG